MPVVRHEFVAYLLAGPRTLDYLARGVSVCFDRNIFSIKSLATGLGDARPAELAADAIALCRDVVKQFPHLLSDGERKSDRDRVAASWPIEPASVQIIHFHDGRVGLRLTDGGQGYLPAFSALDLDSMTQDQLHLTCFIDAQLTHRRPSRGAAEIRW